VSPVEICREWNVVAVKNWVNNWTSWIWCCSHLEYHQTHQSIWEPENRWEHIIEPPFLERHFAIFLGTMWGYCDIL
jgi:hypothetical protein